MLNNNGEQSVTILVQSEKDQAHAKALGVMYAAGT